MISWIFFLFIGLSSSALAQEGFHICYFSLNNEKEFTQMQEFTKKVNKHSNYKITVSEHLTEENSNPEEAFEKMAQETHCDGLVISGHHTGAFGGSRASGSLNISFLEKLSCDKKHQKWFSSIHSLWLQGCRTLGVGKIESVEEEVPAYDPDYHTQRVGAVLDEDNLEQSFADLNMEFSATLDQDNPLSSRYLRTFPKAKVFGWTKTAPGVKAQSEYSVPFHIAHISKLLEKEEIEDPRNPDFNKEQAQGYLDAMQLLLKDWKGKESGCEELTVEGWLHHGQKYGPEPFSFDNRDLQAYQKISSSTDEFQRELKAKECALKAAKTKEEKLKAIDAIASNQSLIQYGFNSIWEALQREEDPEVKKSIQEHLQKNPQVTNFIERKLISKQLGLLRKIDYYGFYKDLTNKGNAKVEALIFEAGLKQLDQEVSEENYAAIDYRLTLLKSLLKNGILDEERFDRLVSSKNLRKSELTAIVDYISKSETVLSNADKFLEKIINSEKSNADTLRDVAYAIGKSKNAIPNADKLLEKIINSEKSAAETLGEVAYAIRNSNKSFPNAYKLLEKIINSEKTDAARLGAVAYVIGQSKNAITNADKLLEKIINSEKSATGALRGVAIAIGSSKNAIPNADKFLEKIINSEKSNATILGDVAYAIKVSKYAIPNADKLLEKIINSEKSNATILGDVAYAIKVSKYAISNADKLLEKIINSKKSDSTTLDEVALTIGNSKNTISNADKLLKKIEERRKKEGN